MNKLAVCFGFLGVFALGCATASILVNDATATPASGTYQCASFSAPHISQRDLAAGKADQDGEWLPASWAPVGGTIAPNGAPSVVACRTAP